MKPLDVNATSAVGASPGTTGANDSETTGLPWLDTWRGVYVFVLGCFIVWVGLFVALTVIFS
jgi:hypothetical protein